MNQTTTATNPLGYERIGKLLRSYAIPSIISLIINSLYNMVDQIFIGQGVGFLGNGEWSADVCQRTVSGNRSARQSGDHLFVKTAYILCPGNADPVLFLWTDRIAGGRTDSGRTGFYPCRGIQL